MKILKAVTVVLCVSMLLAVLSLAGLADAAPYKHRPIQIIGNDEFTKANGVRSGSGTPSDPFIISGWSISAAHREGILVKNTTVSFVIANVSIHSGASSQYPDIDLVSVRNAVIRSSTITGGLVGIYLQVCSNITVEDNTVSQSTLWGIGVSSTTDSNIVGNKVTLSADVGIEISQSDRLVISANEVSSNRNAGIFSEYSGYVTVSGNFIGANGRGVLLNSVQRGFSNGHFLVYGNTFLANTQQAIDADVSGPWDNGYPTGGNYWSDYSGVDLNSGPLQDQPGSDGIGDTPYLLSIYSDVKDSYPLMTPPV